MNLSESRFRLNEILALVYDQLRAYASKTLDREPDGLTIQTTDLVHEVYLRLSQLREIKWEDDQQVMRASVGVMRRILVDHARAKRSLKRSAGGRRLLLDENVVSSNEKATSAFDLLAVDEALAKLETVDERKAEIVELKYFGGFTEQQIADALDVSLATVKRDWKMAKAWLYRELMGEAE
ncbi:MAG TPA: ECF-type sigma factor [Pirellulaceae bacterium]|nr:ECF-type sigma factor [Pirellulaceae bacterium]HMO91599.1 ECF-type sigma factor [Pirellulaceae bacterium]HMP68296.1 ECF-type sigma factor [Pirellulaceae bacterium]